jgi:hypothetical protein
MSDNLVEKIKDEIAKDNTLEGTYLVFVVEKRDATPDKQLKWRH